MSEKIKKKKKARVVPDFSILTDEIFEQIKNELEREKNSPKSYIQEAIEKISEKLIELNSMGYTPGQISKVMERVAGINLTATSIKTHLKRKNIEPAKFQNMPQKEKIQKIENEFQKVEEQKIDRDTKKENPEIENEAQKIEVEKTNVDEIVEAKTDEAIEDIKEIKKDDSVIAEEEMKKLEEEIKNIENDKSISAVRKHEKIESLKDNSIAALKRGGAVIPERPQGMGRDEYMKDISRTREEAAENRTKKKNF